MWNSIDSLRALSHALMWASAILAVLVALATGVRYYVDRRAGELSSQAQRAEVEIKERAQQQREEDLRAQVEAAQQEQQEATNKLLKIEEKVKGRLLTNDQRSVFINQLAAAQKGPITIAYGSSDGETVSFVEEIRTLLKAAGFSMPDRIEHALGYTIKTPPPAFIALVVGTGKSPPYALQIQQAFKMIGINAIWTDGRDIANPGEVRIYIGSKSP
jgi:hypothetical protein